MPVHMWAGQHPEPVQEIGGLWVNSLGRDLRPEDSLSVHSHTVSHCFTYLHEGQGEIVINNHHFNITTGDFIVLPKGYTISQFPDMEHPWAFYWISIDGPLTNALMNLFGWTNKFASFNIGTQTEFIDYFNRILDRIHELPYGRYHANSLGYQLLAYLGDLTCEHHEDKHYKPTSTINDIITYLGRHLHEPLTVDDIAAHFSLSHSQLARRFRIDAGMSPAKYLNELRIDRAKAMLFSNKPVSLIAEMIGIQDVNYFYRLFKHTTGLTPQQYRVKIVRPEKGC